MTSLLERSRGRNGHALLPPEKEGALQRLTKMAYPRCEQEGITHVVSKFFFFSEKVAEPNEIEQQTIYKIWVGNSGIILEWYSIIQGSYQPLTTNWNTKQFENF